MGSPLDIDFALNWPAAIDNLSLGEGPPLLLPLAKPLAYCSRLQRFSNRTGMPRFGRSVMEAISSTGGFGNSRKLHFCPMIASKTCASICAHAAPMHTRGPPPNGKHAKRGKAFSISGVHRSGKNRSGSAKNRASRCTVHCGRRKLVPAGSQQSPKLLLCTRHAPPPHPCP